MADHDTVQIVETSMFALREALDRGECSVRTLTEACLARIAAMDRQGPALRAVIETNPDALTIADELDAELQAGRSRGPLHGIPILLKDNIATIDPMETTAGSAALIGARPVRDAFLVGRLRAAGAVIIGKANLSEWSNFRSTHSVSGWSARGGQCVNPYQLDRTPWGSSAGPAVAVAASYVPLAVGTETNGSIVTPAGANGVVGIKPTVGLVSRRGVIPISRSQDTVGPMARSVAEAAALLNVLAAPDPEDPATHETRQDRGGPGYPARPGGMTADAIDYTAGLDADGLRGARIGVLRTDPRPGFADAVLAPILSTLKAAGATIVDPVTVPSSAEQRWGSADISILLSEFKADIADYLQAYVDEEFPIRNLADLIAFNERESDQELRWFGQELFERAQNAVGVDDPTYLEWVTNAQRNSRELGLDAVMAEHNLDAIVALTNAPAAKIDLLNGDSSSWGSSGLAALAGYPLVTVPAAAIGGMPIGLTFMGGAYSEVTLIRLAHAFEQQTNARREPAYAPPGILPPA